jgi:hypothetical protein
MMTKTKSIPLFFIHSTFRNFMGRQVKPHGLEWGLDGDARVTYVPASFADGKSDQHSLQVDYLDAPENRRGIVEAYNRWAFAKELEFKSTDDILGLTVHKDGKHIQVEWKKDTGGGDLPYTATAHDLMEELLKNDPAAKGGELAEVWVNGVYEGTLDGEMSLSPLLLAIRRATGPGTRMSYYRYEGLIRIEKYFRGMLRKHQVFEHIMDNLIALEDPEILDSKTLIGTATVADWIMGGQLTSRLHVEVMENGDVKFVRPLYNDDISTADRHFGLFKGRDDVKIAMVRKELDRLRYLASLQHPFESKKWGADSKADKETQQHKNDVILMDKVPDTMDDLSVSSSVVFLEDTEDSPALSHASSTFSD